MKYNFDHTVFFSLLFVTLISCDDDPVEPVDVETAVTASLNKEFIELSDLSGESFTVRIETSNSIESYSLHAVLIQGNISSNSSLVFSTNTFPYEETLSPKSIIAGLGVIESDISLGDELILYGVVKAKDGREFAAYPEVDSNVSAEVLAAEDQPFYFKIPINCASILEFTEGSYYMEVFNSELNETSTSGSPIPSGNVSLASDTDQFSKSFTINYSNNFEVELVLDFTCDMIMLSDTVDTGVSCGDGSNVMIYPRLGGTYSETVDGRFTVVIDHDGISCLGVYEDSLVLQFTM